jgi:hypothetical protein
MEPNSDVDPIKAAMFGAPPAPAIPVAVQNTMPQMPPMPQIGEPGGFGVFAFRMADMIRRYGQQSRQRS